jgi:hypothetical protein
MGAKLGKMKIIMVNPSLLDFEVMRWERCGNTSRHLRIVISKDHEMDTDEVTARRSSV